MTVGVVLIVVGVAFFLRPRFDFFESEYLLLLLGALFLGGYLWQRRYGLMVPAGVLLGLGAGQLLDGALSGPTQWGQLALGLGFLGVFAVPLALGDRSHWWPLIPGAVLILSALEQTEDLVRYLFENWPLLLVLIGVALVTAGWFGRGRSRSS
jgi:hypothetical protein